MNEKIFNTRIVHKHDTAENWDKAANFIPKAGELIIYDEDATHSYPRIKIGDGVKTVGALEFIGDIEAELITIEDIDRICGSVTPISEVLF